MMSSLKPLTSTEPKGPTITRGSIPPNPALALWSTTIGKKVVMGVTGAVLVLFVIAHMVGNLKMFSGPGEINAYSRFLREVGQPELGYGQLLWIVRIVLLTCVLLHILAAYQLTRISHAARPIGYRGGRKDVETSFSARAMRWGGVLLAIFIVFHILHFTVGAVGFRPGQYKDLAVYQNVVAGFSVWPISVFYIVAMGALCLHLDHGIWSMLQTFGWNTVKSQKTLRGLSRIVAIIVFLGFISIPVAVMAGWLR
jgi:succinate dehydrogenase / fumarate reductase, cytochrome b subunit